MKNLMTEAIYASLKIFRNVIKSWDIGVATMKKGEIVVLTCALQYAYGPDGSPPTIPPDAILKFEVEVLGWKGEDISPQKTMQLNDVRLNQVMVLRLQSLVEGIST